MADGPMPTEAAIRQAMPEVARAKIPINPDPAKQAEIAAAAAAHQAYVDANPQNRPSESLVENLGRADKATAQKSDETREQNIGTTIDKKTGKKIIKPGTPENTRKTEAKNLDDAHQEIIDKKGKIDITQPQFKEIRKQLDDMLDSGPLSSLKYMQPNEREAFYNELFQDEAVLKAVMEGQATNLNESIADNVSAVRTRAEAAKNTYDSKKAERGVKATELRTAKTDKDSFDDEVTAGTKGHQLKELRDKKLGLELSKRQTELRQVDAWLTDPTKMPAGENATDLQKRQSDLLTKIDDLKTEQDKMAQMEREKTALPDKISGLEEVVQRLDTEFTEADREYKDAASELSSAILQRGKAEQDWIDRKKVIARDAIAKVIDANMTQVGQEDQARLEQLKNEAKTQLEKDLATNITKRYFSDRNPSLLNRSRIDINKANATADVRVALTPGNNAPELLIDKALIDAGITDPAKRAEIMKDPAFVNKWGGEMLQQSMSAYLRTGGKLSAEEGLYLESTTWGKGLIDKALATSKAAKDMDRKLQEAGIKGGLREFMKTKKGIAAGGIIAILLAVAAGALTGPIGAGAVLATAGGAEAANFNL